MTTRSSRFELQKKNVSITIRLPRALLAAVRSKAEARGIPYQRFIREALEKAV